MRQAPSVSRWHVILDVVAGLGIAGALVVLYFFNPATSGIYPVCLLHQTTGLLCPGCGSLRAMHQLVHGNFLAAWHLNAFLITLLPVAGWLALREVVYVTTGRLWPGIVTRPVFLWLFLAGLILFGVLRNLPMFRSAALSS